MKLNDAIRMADALRDNAIAEEQKVIWINELEMKIQSLILRTAPDDMEVYALPEDGEIELLVPRPFDKVYYLWLAAMIDYGNAEYDKYQNDKAMADAAYSDYAKWFMRHFHDDCGNVMYIGGTTKYGLSAYQIAVNHGFEGTEEEWLFSLNGKDAYTVAVEKGYEGTEAEFYAQLGVLNGIEERVSADAAAAEAAAERAETATQGIDAKVDAAETAAQIAVAATLNAPKIVNGTWWVYDAARSAYVDTGVEAHGDDGVSPTVSVTTITGGKRVTITDASGEHVFDIMDGEDGNDGDDGVSPGVSITPISGGHRIIITDATGAHSFDVMNGKDGAAGAGTGDMLASVYDPQGKRTDVYQYVDDALENLDMDVTADEVTFSDGETFQQKYDSGELKGEPGEPGEPGSPGSPGAPGDPGTSVTVTSVTESTEDGGSNVVTFSDGKTLTVKNGSKGSNGKTPVKGEDYFTAADKQKMVDAVVAEMGGSGGGSSEKFIVTAEQGAQNDTLGAPYSGVVFAVTDVSHSYDEIIAAYNAGKEIELQLYMSSAYTDSSGMQITQAGTSFFPLSDVYETRFGTTVQPGVTFGLGMQRISCIIAGGSDAWYMYQYY